MSTTSSNATVIATTQATIQFVTAQITYYSPIVLLVIGITGCFCNFLTFTSPQLRNNPCSFYFLISAVFELLSITFGLISRFAADQLGSTLINTDPAYCKLRAYLVSALPLVATYFILLSSVDRCLSSCVSARLRSFSQMKMAYRATGVAIAIGFVSCLHILVGYNLRPRCGALAGAFSMYDGMFVVFWLGVIPHILMLIFGFITCNNVKRSKRRVAIEMQRCSITSQTQRRDSKTERQLLIMMLVQVGFSSLLILTRMIYYAYFLLAPPLTGYNRLVGSFMSSFTIQLYYANYVKSFYIYTLSSQLFRSVFVDRIKFVLRKTLRTYTPVVLLDATERTRRSTIRTSFQLTARRLGE